MKLKMDKTLTKRITSAAIVLLFATSLLAITMKQSNLKAWLCLCGGILVALWVNGGMWHCLHWPGGYAQLITDACLTIIFGCVLAVWLGKSNAFDSLIATRGKSALHLRNSLIGLSSASCFLSLSVIFRLMRWPFNAQLVILSCVTITILLILIGIWGYKLTKK